MTTLDPLIKGIRISIQVQCVVYYLVGMMYSQEFLAGFSTSENEVENLVNEVKIGF